MPQPVLTPAIREEIARLERADIMVGIPSFKNATTIGYVVRAAQAGLVQYFPDLRPVVVNSDAGSPDGTGRVVVETEPPDYVERILLVRPTNKLSRVSLTYPENEGTITNNVTYPLTRALYGLRIRQPIGGDFGVSGDLVRHYLSEGYWTPEVSKFGSDLWMNTLALN